MRLYLIPSLIAYTLTGCKDSGANTGDVGVDYIIDVFNKQITEKPTDEQRKKYSGLTGNDCVTKMTTSIEKLVKDESMKKQLPSEGQTLFEGVRLQAPESRKVTIGELAKAYCTSISLLFK